ncbi:MAG: PAS domain S-box protein [Bacillota bacterium]
MLWLSFSWLAALVIAWYYHYYLGIDVVYTHFFYFVLIITSIYAHRFVIPAAVCLGSMHVILGFLNTGMVTSTTLVRALMMMFVAIILYGARYYFYTREKELKEKQAKLQLLVENVSDVPWILNLRTLQWEYMSPSIERLTGYTLDEILSQPVAQILTQEAYPIVVEKIGQRIENFNRNGSSPHTYKDWLEHTRKDGSTVLVELISKYMRNEHGDLLLIGISRDISDRYQMEQKLAFNHAIMDSLLANTPNLMLFVDKHGRYMMVSQTLADTFGLPPEEIKGKHLSEVMPASLASRYMEHINTIIRKQEPIVSVELIPAEDGYRAFEMWGFPLIKQEDQVELIGSIGLEVTERKKAEEKVRQQNLEILALTNNVSDIIARFDKDLRYVYTNQKNKTDRLIGKTNRELGMPEPNLTIWEDAIRTAFRSRSEQTVETSNYGPRGMRYYHSVISPEMDEEGEVSTVITVTRDITDLKELQLALSLEKQNLYITLESIGDGVVSTDCMGNITLINKVAEKLTGWTQAEAHGRPFEEVFHIVDELTGELRENPIQQVLTSRKTIELDSHMVLISKQGMKTPVEDTAAPIIDENGNVVGAVVVFRDFTEKREKQKEIVYLSYHDQLTGLYNRRFFEEEKKRLDTPRNLPITLVMADVNGLKLTNDAFGHSVGDELLRRAAEVIKKELRADDIIARIGGDEFCILLPKTSSREAEGIIKRIRKAVAQEKVGNAVLSISFGWGTKQESGEDMDQVFKRAEDEMYRYKLSESTGMRYQTVKLIIQGLYAKHTREELHSFRVSQLCGEIGSALGLSLEAIRELRTGGLMHDIGKITIDENILEKSGPLTESERLEVNRHVETGYRILSSVNEFAQIAEFVLAHHERWDGWGYPRGLKGEEIPLEARIIAIADAYDAMTTERPYCRALSKEEAIRELRENAGSQFDPVITQVFIEKVLGE